MNVLEYLSKMTGLGPEERLKDLSEIFGLISSRNTGYPDLYLLDCPPQGSYWENNEFYRAICSECRSLLLRWDGRYFQMESRGLDRQFPYKEAPFELRDKAVVEAHGENDGDVLYLHFSVRYGWLYRTRHLLMPTGIIEEGSLRWETVIKGALDINNLNIPEADGVTYIFKISPSDWKFNSKKQTASLLAIRDNEGRYESSYRNILLNANKGWCMPQGNVGGGLCPG